MPTADSCGSTATAELIKTHPVQEPGGRHTDYDDYPKEKTPYAMRNPDYMISLARGRGPNIGVFMTRLLEGNFPWSRLRQAQKLIRLVDKYSAGVLESASRRALGFDLINVARLEQIVLRSLDRDGDNTATPDPPGKLVQGALRFLRQPSSFTHDKEDPDNGDS